MHMNKVFTILFVMSVGGLPSASADNDVGMHIVMAAREQIGKTVRYDPLYQYINYPNGDVPMDRGVCTDVIIRAFRAGLGLDLQELIHEDMKRNFKKYPKNWRLRSPDKNIDHRRVANMQTFLALRRCSIAVSNQANEYIPGDLVTCIVPVNLPHIMIVSDKKTMSGQPLVIHNIGSGTKEEDRLFEFELTGHYRIKRIEQIQPKGGAELRR